MQDNAVHTQQQKKKVERVHGIQSGELFVRINGAALYEPQGTLHGAHPFLQKLLHLHDDDSSAVPRLVQPSEAKLTFSRKLRWQIRQRRRTVRKRWDAVREAVEVYDDRNLSAVAIHLLPIVNPASDALDRYVQQFQKLEQAYKQHVMSDILHLYALLEAESQYITAWNKREEVKNRDQRTLTKLLYQFNSFALQLESETSGQVRMWRLPPTDAQCKRCVKAAIENIKKRFFTSSSRSLEVLEVYKIENRVLLDTFQRFTSSLAWTASDLKIKGLFCSVPADSVERCVVYGMHATPGGESGEPRFVDNQGAEVKVFNRSVYGQGIKLLQFDRIASRLVICATYRLHQGREDAPGTSMAFRARAKVNNGTLLQFPRRFSRYSTLEEMRISLTTSETPVQYLGLCRVAISKTLRVKDNTDASFPEDSSVGTLHFTNEEEYLVRYPDAVVPEFIVQFRVKIPSPSLPVDFSGVSLTSSAPNNLAFSAFQDFIYSAHFDDPSSTISAFPLALPPSDRQSSFFTPNDSPASSSSLSPASQQQEEEVLADEQLQISPETVLANCARQKEQLREDLQSLDRLFWTRAREIWEEEGIHNGVKIQRDNQLHNSQEEMQTRTQQLRGELDMINQMQDDLSAKTQPQYPKHSSARRRR